MLRIIERMLVHLGTPSSFREAQSCKIGTTPSPALVYSALEAENEDDDVYVLTSSSNGRGVGGGKIALEIDKDRGQKQEDEGNDRDKRQWCISTCKDADDACDGQTEGEM